SRRRSLDGCCGPRHTAHRLRGHRAPRSLVGSAASAGTPACDADLLRELGGVSGEQLPGRRLPVAALLAAHQGELVPLLPRLPDSSAPDPLPRYLLLLSQGLLPLVSPRSTGVRRVRVPRLQLPGGNRVPADPAEPAPLFVLHNVLLPVLPV